MISNLAAGLANFKKTMLLDSLNSLRTYAHNDFDRIWQRRHMSRTQAYAWLSENMGTKPQNTHIAQFSAEQCREVIRLAQEFMSSVRKP